MAKKEKTRLEVIESEINSLKKSIKKLKKEADEIIKKQMEGPNLSIIQKFDLWLDSPNAGKGNGDDWYPFNNYCSFTLDYISDRLELNRYQTYDVLELLYERLYGPKENEDDEEGIDMEDFEIIAKELMAANLLEFKYDW